jgi:rhodanese-related sulfurtransferase
VADVPEIDIDALEGLLSSGAVVVDVREDDEYADGHVSGAVHIPLGTVPQRFEEIPGDRPVYVICARGSRSARAVEFLRAKGIDAVNVAGGTLAWTNSDRPVVTGTQPS